MTNSDPITNLFEPLKLTIGKGYEKINDLYSLTNKFYIFDYHDLSQINQRSNLQESFKLYKDLFVLPSIKESYYDIINYTSNINHN